MKTARFSFDAEQNRERVTFRPYDGVPAVIAYSNGHYAHEPTWYRNFLYSEEQARGLGRDRRSRVARRVRIFPFSETGGADARG